MGTQEEARKVLTENRQHRQNVQQNMLSRTAAEIEQLSQSAINEESRELIVKARKHQHHLQDSLLSRSEAEINKTEI
jgi:hypothetical protein